MGDSITSFSLSISWVSWALFNYINLYINTYSFITNCNIILGSWMLKMKVHGCTESEITIDWNERGFTVMKPVTWQRIVCKSRENSPLYLQRKDFSAVARKKAKSYGKGRISIIMFMLFTGCLQSFFYILTMKFHSSL